MSKFITIKEGDTARNFTEEKLKTPLQGGGNALWVPKDGTTLKTKRVNEPGVYKAKDDEAYGYSTFTTYGMVEKSKTELIKKSVAENGTYKAESDRAYGYSKVVVNVPGGGDYKDENGLDATSPPSYDPGSSVAGNGTDGAPITVAVDDNGNLIRLGLADHILLDTPPNKLEYRDGERIVMEGAVVRGYLANGTPYKNSSYQDSILPFYQGEGQTETESAGEWQPGGVVIVSPLTAEKGETSEGYYDNTIDLSTVEQPIPAGSGFQIYYYTSRMGPENPALWLSASAIGNTKLVFVTKNVTPHERGLSGYLIAVDMDENIDNDRYIASTVDSNGTVSQHRAHSSYTYQGKTVYYLGGTYAFTTAYLSEYSGSVIKHTASTTLSVPANLIAWIIRYGDYSPGGKQIITLTWPREGDRKFLTTTFEITVTE